MSDTPRTDSIRKRFAGKKVSSTECAELYEHASELERELVEVTKQRDELMESIRLFQTGFEAIQWGYDGACGSARLADILFDSLAAVKGGDA